MKHIVLVEDQSSGRFILSHALKEAGYKVTAAENGLEGYLAVKELYEKDELPDLLVTDIEMPELSGPEMIDQIDEMNIDLPKVVMTAHGSKQIVVELMRKGVNEYIDKPFEPEELIAMVKIVLDKHERDKVRSEEAERKIAGERDALLQQVASYKVSYDKLKEQIDSAKHSYSDLISIDTEGLGLQVAYRLKPLADLGGDLIDVKKSPQGYDLLIADVAGHDMGASFHTILLKTVFEENAKAGIDGKTFFENLNKILLDNGRNERMITAQFVRINTKEKQLSIVSAAHPYPIKIETGFPVARPIYAKGDVLGIHDEVEYEEHTSKLLPGTRLILYTDGLTDVYSIDGATGRKTRLTADRLDEMVKLYQDQPLEMMIDNIWQDVLKFCKYKYKDDMTLFGVEIP